MVPGQPCAWPGVLRRCAHDAEDPQGLIFVRTAGKERTDSVHLNYDAPGRPDVDAYMIGPRSSSVAEYSQYCILVSRVSGLKIRLTREFTNFAYCNITKGIV